MKTKAQLENENKELHKLLRATVDDCKKFLNIVEKFIIVLATSAISSTGVPEITTEAIENSIESQTTPIQGI